jgi:hypothetical protein
VAGRRSRYRGTGKYCSFISPAVASSTPAFSIVAPGSVQWGRSICRVTEWPLLSRMLLAGRPDSEADADPEVACFPLSAKCSAHLPIGHAASFRSRRPAAGKPACRTGSGQTRRRSGLLVSGTVVLRLDGACGPKCRLRSRGTVRVSPSPPGAGRTMAN